MAWNTIVNLRADGLNWRGRQSISLVLKTAFILINYKQRFYFDKLQTAFILINYHHWAWRRGQEVTWSTAPLWLPADHPVCRLWAEPVYLEWSHAHTWTSHQLNSHTAGNWTHNLLAAWKQTSAAIWCVTAETTPRRPLLVLHQNSGHSVGSVTSTSLLFNLQPISSRQEAQKNK